MNPVAILPTLFVVAVLIGWARLAWWQARAPAALRARWWRIAILAVAQPVAAALLYLTLSPPPVAGSTATLLVATANALRLATATGPVVALPEAPAIPGAERAPDLATALRRHPGLTRIRIVGDGLEARDRDAARGLALAFAPPADRRGIISLAPPPATAPGAAFRIGGYVANVPGGRVELLDPAGARADLQPLSTKGDFTVTGTTRVAGVALAKIRVRDRNGALVEDADVPLRTADDAQPRLLILAGAPSPEVKYLRRWATDAGMTATARVSVGGGVVLGDAPVAIDAATLARTDTAILDERSWAGLGAGTRSAIVAAVRGGMGLVVRTTGPVPDESRRQWRALGIVVPGGSATAPVVLDGLPVLTRSAIGTTPDAVPVWRDARGATLADWHAVGRGRVVLWRVLDAFTLVLTGHDARYGDTWATTIAAVARPRGSGTATIAPLPRTGERITICAIGTDARVDGTQIAIDPTSGGCSGYWPTHAGWHLLTDRAAALPFYVYPADALPALRAHNRAAATAALRRDTAIRSGGANPAPGAAWPWFVALLAFATAWWWFERARVGRRTAAPPIAGAESA